MRKPIAELPEADCRAAPLWRFSLDERPGEDETWAEPVRSKRLNRPPTDLACVATDLKLADGSTVFGLISAPSGKREVDDQTTRVSVFLRGRRTDLAGYYDDADEIILSPERFAAALLRTTEQVFPIQYDVSSFFGGEPEQWRGQIFERPPHPLSEDELMDLIVKNLE